MKFSFAIEVALLTAGLVAANGKKALTGPPAEIRRAASLFSRQTTEFCPEGGDTCAECYGEGNIVCEVDYCYNPDAGEQCCADGTYCEGSASCCSDNGGLGIGTPDDDTSAAPSATSSRASSVSSTSLPTGTPDSWDCEQDDTSEECCQRGDDDYRFCPGGDNLSSIVCYNPSAGEVCCSDGTSCNDGSDCCGSVGLFTSATEGPTTRVVSTRTSVSLNTQGPTQRTTTTQAPTNVGAPGETSPPGAGNTNGVKGGAMAVAAGILGMVLL